MIIKLKTSEQLVSTDEQNGVANFKFTFSVEIPRICKDDLIILPEKLRKSFGCASQLLLCRKVTTSIHLIDIQDGKTFELSEKAYFQSENEMTVIPEHGNTTEFMIIDQEQSMVNLNKSFSTIISKHKLDMYRITAARTNDWTEFQTKTHLRHLKQNRIAKGYDLSTMTFIDDLKLKSSFDVIMVKIVFDKEKKQQKKRIWRLKRMEIEEAEERKKKKEKVNPDKEDFEDFLDDLEQDKDLRSKITLFQVYNLISN